MRKLYSGQIYWNKLYILHSYQQNSFNEKSEIFLKSPNLGLAADFVCIVDDIFQLLHLAYLVFKGCSEIFTFHTNREKHIKTRTSRIIFARFVQCLAVVHRVIHSWKQYVLIFNRNLPSCYQTSSYNSIWISSSKLAINFNTLNYISV